MCLLVKLLVEEVPGYALVILKTVLSWAFFVFVFVFFNVEGTSNGFRIFLENAFSVSWFHIYAMLWNGYLKSKIVF